MNKYSKYVNTEELKNERKKRKLSIANMAKLMGFNSKVTYYNIETGITEPKISHINKISEILGKSGYPLINYKVQ